MLTRNPFYKKIEPACSSEAVASYGGIAFRSLWFWLLCAVGMAVYFIVPTDSIPPAVLLGGACVVFTFPFLIYWVPATASVAGSAYSVVQGFLLALICSKYASEYSGIIYLAVGITALVFFTVLMLYRNGIVKVNSKFRGILLALFLASIAGSGIVYISSFFTTAITDFFFGNRTIAIIVSAFSLLISVMNLIYEFDFATNLVENGIRKKYEWLAAYGLIMTVILIFIRILNLLAKFMPKRGN